MAQSPDPATRSTRLAANVAAAAVVAYAVLWFITTQVAAVRAVSPFADDPWDAVASYAAIFLPIVAGATWIRSLRHRGPTLPTATAARIRWGAGLAVGIVLASVGADLLAIAAATAPALIVLLVGVAGLTAAVAVALLVRAAIIARTTAANAAAPGSSPGVTEPDVVDDLLALAVDVARPIGIGRPIGRLTAVIERFLERSSISPRRHRVGFGVVLAVAAAVFFDAWHAIVEGRWASPAALVVFGALAGVGVLAVYLGTVVPLRLLRPAGGGQT